MISPLEQISGIYALIRELQKMDSKLLSGQVIQAHRDLNRIIADLERISEKMIYPDGKGKSKKDNISEGENN